MNFAVSDSYFVVAHFHYVLAGTVLFAMFGGFYFWWPKMTGKMLNSKLGKAQFWLMFIGFNMTFLVQHWAGVQGHVAPDRELPVPAGGRDHAEHHLHRRVVAAGGLDPHVHLERLHHRAVRPEGHGRRPVGLRQLAGVGDLLPAARHNFYRIPRIRSERPAFELHYPHIVSGRASSGIEQAIPAISAAKK